MLHGNWRGSKAWIAQAVESTAVGSEGGREVARGGKRQSEAERGRARATLDVISQSALTRSPGRSATVPSSPTGTPSMDVNTSFGRSVFGSCSAVEDALRGARALSGLTAETTTPVVASGTFRYRRKPRFSRCSVRKGTEGGRCERRVSFQRRE